MGDREQLLRQISPRGDRYGGSGGLLDLLLWCGKQGIHAVTAEEARLFLEAPDAPYPAEQHAAKADAHSYAEQGKTRT